MNPIAPLTDTFDAVASLFRFVFVVGLCFAINAVTSPGHWWAQWVALGMGIAVFVAWARAIKSVLVALIVGAIGVWIFKRYGADARSKFEAEGITCGADLVDCQRLAAFARHFFATFSQLRDAFALQSAVTF
jgi:hypothetical protein